MNTRKTSISLISVISGPAATLAIAVLLFETVLPGIVGRWVPVAPSFFVLLALAACASLMARRRS